MRKGYLKKSEGFTYNKRATADKNERRDGFCRGGAAVGLFSERLGQGDGHLHGGADGVGDVGAVGAQPLREAEFRPPGKDLRGGEGAGRVGGGEDEGRIPGHQRQDGREVLVRHHPVDKDEGRILSVGEQGLQSGVILLQRRRIVADVGDDGRHLGELLPAPPETGAGGRMDDAVDDGFGILQTFVNGNVPENVQRGEHRAEILFLIGAAEVHLAEHLAVTGPEGRPLRLGVMQGTEHQGGIVEGGGRFRRALPHQGGGILLEDAGFLVGDLPDRMAEEVAVVEADIGDDGEVGLQDIGAVEPAAEPRLDHGDVDVGIGEPLETETRGNFEERQALLDEIGFPLREEGEYIFLRDHLPVDADALPEITEMRRGEKAGAEPRRPEGGSEHRRDRALAVGPRHMDAAETAFGMAERLAEGLHRLQPGLVRPRLEPVPLHGRKQREYFLYQCAVRALLKIHINSRYIYKNNHFFGYICE